MWPEVVAFFLGISILFYCLFAGADFGAGILEFFLDKRRHQDQKKLITHAMGPVWEANHVWLILAVVILFNGFPKAYSELSITFHIPLTLMLLGVILRGSAFTFRHYDAVRDNSQKYYSAIFIISSILTPITLGLIAGGILLGEARGTLLSTLPAASSSHPVTQDYFTTYIAPWFNLFSLSVGLFVCILFSFLAAVYLVGETQDEELRRIFVKKAKGANILAVIAGGLVFGAAEVNHLPLIQKFLQDGWALGCMGLATVILVPLWMSLIHRRILLSRVFAASQVALVLLGWFKIQFPILIVNSAQHLSFTIYNAAAPDETLRYLFLCTPGWISRDFSISFLFTPYF